MLDSDAALLDYRNEMGQSAILLAKYHRRQDAVDFLLARGPALTLHEACAVGAIDTVRQALRERGRMIDEHSIDGFTPLALACFFAQPEIARLLIDQGANVNLAANNAMKVAPVHAAVAARQSAILKMLVEAGADVNARQQAGFTPLHAAAQNGDEAATRMLLAAGADRQARADNQQSPLDMALLGGHGPVAELLGETG